MPPSVSTTTESFSLYSTTTTTPSVSTTTTPRNHISIRLHVPQL
ncbi:unnamed protein product [Larinioides sclopetarius]|uniref:Uncharacterized protein n=1 Tax=Larinioides sclopetarius TaxID=280406 RepID=A0AAV2BRB6_9ARAC